MENLIILRKNKNKTQTQIAKVLNMSQQAYCKIEKGITSLSLEQAIILCNYYKITLDELLNIPKQKKPDMVEFEKKEELTDKQKELLEYVKQLNDYQCNVAKVYFETLLDNFEVKEAKKDIEKKEI